MSILDNLPKIDFVEKDTATIEKEIITYFEKAIGRKLYDGDPMRLFLLAFVKYISLQRSLIDFSAKQNLLSYSTDNYIEHIAALVGVTRLEPISAETTLKFILSEAQNSTITIPKGTRATSDSRIYFSTLEDVEIAIGELDTEVVAECTVKGEIGNGFYVGQINKLVDSFGYLTTVENITQSAGGADLESLESFRQRIRVAPESFSTAGPDGAYEFWTKTANQLISDVSVTSPNPGEVEIIPLLQNGEMPTRDILNNILKICNDKTKRPLTDKVLVMAPQERFYNIDLIYYIAKSNYTLSLSIQNNINIEIKNYILWQKSKLGRDLNPSELTRRMITAGAKRIEIISPVFTTLKHYEIAVVDSVNIVYGGIEDD